MRGFWPIGEAAQADYEELRGAALTGCRSLGPISLRFESRGLAGLIAWPAAEPVFAASVVGATRPPWVSEDPRLAALVAVFELLEGASRGTTDVLAVQA